MKSLLSGFAFLSLICGTVVALYAIFSAPREVLGTTTSIIIGAACVLFGLAGYAVFSGIAEILERLERLEKK